MPERGGADAGEPVGRVFSDAAGRKWRAELMRAENEGVLEFTCLEEPREPARVTAVSSGFSFVGVSDQSLRALLAAAPPMGRLNE